MARTPAVVVIGGGVAGLSAAVTLASRGCRVVLLEARERLGGRILTRIDPAVGLPRELGAEFIHGRSRTTRRMLREAKLKPLRIRGEHLALREGRLEAFGDEWGELLERVARAERDVPFSRFSRRFSASERRAANAYVAGYYAADPDRVSARWIATLEQASAEVHADSFIARPLNGWGALVGDLARRLRALGGEIHLSTEVCEVRWSQQRVRVRARTLASGEGRFDAEAAVITLPLGVLQAGTVRFDPPLSKAGAIAQLEDGPIVKAILRFRRPIWNDSPRAGRRELLRAAFFHAWSEPFPTFWTPTPADAPWLIGWAAGPSARALSGRPELQVRRAAMRSIAEIFGVPERTLARELDAFEHYDWGADPFARGGYTSVPAGALEAWRSIAEPEAQTLFFAGEATHLDGQAGTVHGAFETGERAARELLRALG